MSNYWAPAGNSFIASATAQLIVSATGQVEGLARIVNTGTSLAFVGLVSASATIGNANLSPIPGGVTLFIAFGAAQRYVVVTGGSTVYAQSGYALK